MEKALNVMTIEAQKKAAASAGNTDSGMDKNTATDSIAQTANFFKRDGWELRRLPDKPGWYAVAWRHELPKGQGWVPVVSTEYVSVMAIEEPDGILGIKKSWPWRTEQVIGWKEIGELPAWMKEESK